MRGVSCTVVISPFVVLISFVHGGISAPLPSSIQSSCLVRPKNRLRRTASSHLISNKQLIKLGLSLPSPSCQVPNASVISAIDAPPCLFIKKGYIRTVRVAQLDLPRSCTLRHVNESLGPLYPCERHARHSASPRSFLLVLRVTVHRTPLRLSRLLLPRPLL